MPGPLPRTKSNGWWNRRWPYRVFLLRELSSVAVAVYVALLLVLVSQVRDGAGAFADYLDVLQSPLFWIIHAVVLAFVLLHTVTWFQAMPKGLPLKIAGRRVPPVQLIAGNYVALVVVSVIVLAAFVVEW